MKLLFDEHYARDIAEQLRERGHDAVAVTERPELTGLRDDQLFDLMAAERRAIVTENWPHFAELIRRATQEGADHRGVVFTSAKRLPRGKNTIGLFVRVFDEFLGARPAEDALLNSHCWLP